MKEYTKKIDIPNSNKGMIKKILTNKLSIILIIFLLIALVLFIVVQLFGNAGDEEVLVSPTKTSCAGVESLTWQLPDLPQHQSVHYQSIIESFIEDNGLKLTISITNKKYNQNDYEVDYYNDFIRDMALGKGPDIIALTNNDLLNYKEYIIPLESFTQAQIANYRNDFVDIVSKDTIIDNKVYGVTLYVDNLQLLYNKQILQNEGFSQPARNWETIFQHASNNNLTQIDINNNFVRSAVALGLGSNIKNSSDIFVSVVNQSGFDIFNSEIASNGSNSQDVQEATTLISSFTDEFSSSYSWNSNQNQDFKEFIDGNLVYMFGYKEDYDSILKARADLEIGATTLPQLDINNRHTVGKFFANSMSRKLDFEGNEQKKSCAELFLKHLTKETSISSYVQKVRLPPAQRSLIDSYTAQDDFGVFLKGALFADSYNKADEFLSNFAINKFLDNYSITRDFGSNYSTLTSDYQRILLNGPQIRNYKYLIPKDSIIN